MGFTLRPLLDAGGDQEDVRRHERGREITSIDSTQTAYNVLLLPGELQAQPKPSAAEQPLVDTSLLQTAINTAASATTPDEQTEAREAWRLADHELDLRFAAAIRDAEAAAPLPTTGLFSN